MQYLAFIYISTLFMGLSCSSFPKITTTCSGASCETCWDNDQNSLCTSCLDKINPVYVQVPDYRTYLSQGGLCKQTHSKTDSNISISFYISPFPQKYYAHVVMQNGLCPKNPCPANITHCQAEKCFPYNTSCLLPNCEICSEDGSKCYSCPNQLVVDNMREYWANGAESCSNNCENTYNSEGHIFFKYKEGAQMREVYQEYMCIKDFPCSNNSSICSGMPTITNATFSECGGSCQPRFQCPEDIHNTQCAKCYPGITTPDVCLNCIDEDHIQLDHMSSYQRDLGAQCGKSCLSDDNVQFELQYILYDNEIIANICLENGDCKDNPCDEIEKISGVSNCEIWECKEGSWSFPTWGIVFCVIGGIILIGGITTWILFRRKPRRKRSLGDGANIYEQIMNAEAEISN